MRIRSSHMGVVLLLLGLFILYAIFSRSGGDDEDFFDDIHRRQANTSLSEGAGALPPTGMSLDMAPQIAVDSQEIHLGTIPFEKEYESSFFVYNKGKMPLVISDIKTSCACTVGSVRDMDKTIPPGEKRSVNVVVHPKKIPLFHSRKTLTILSNDPKTMELKVTVEADIVPEIALSAEEIDLGVLQKGEEAKATLRIQQLLEAPLVLEKVEESGQQSNQATGVIRGEIREVPEAQWQRPGKAEFDVDILIAPEVSPGELHGRITIFTNLRRLNIFYIPITAKIESFYSVSPKLPKRVRLMPLEDLGGVHEGIAILKAARPFTIEDLRYNDAKIQVVQRPGEEENSLQLQVQTLGEIEGEELMEDVFFSVVSGEQRLPEKIGIQGTGHAAQDAHAGHNH